MDGPQLAVRDRGVEGPSGRRHHAEAIIDRVTHDGVAAEPGEGKEREGMARRES